jgi:carboxyl-terminal processing protease
MAAYPLGRTPRRSLLTAALALLAACSGRGPAEAVPAQSTATPVDTELAVATFDTAWSIIYRTHFDTTFNGVDWLALKDELRPRAESATTVSELRGAIEEMVDRLGQSHFALIPQGAVDAFNPYEREDVGSEVGYMGLQFRTVGEQMVVTGVDKGSTAETAGVRSGWVIVSVDGDSVADLLAEVRESESRYADEYRAWARVQGRLGGAPGDVKTMEFLDASDDALTLEIALEPDERRPVKFGNLPTFFSSAEAYELTSAEYGVDVGVIWFNFWMAPLMREIDGAVDEFRELDGIIVDLRGNAGGMGVMVSGLAGHFLDEPLLLGTFRTRQTDLVIKANPRRVDTNRRRVSPYEGPVAILSDELSGSASEVFAGGMQAVGRVRVFGKTSIGAVLPAIFDRLPNGDVLYHAFAEFVTPDGVTLEGRGVIPDEAVALTREEFLAGRDPVLRAAIRWIAEQRAAGGGTTQH